MSRAMNLNETLNAVVDMCAKHGALISVAEPLHSGGTRLVLKSGNDVAKIHKAFGNKVITGEVVRTPTRLMHR